MRRLVYVLAVIILGSSILTQQVVAISPQDEKNLYTPFYDPTFAATCSQGDGLEVTGNNNTEIAFNFFVNVGLTPEQSAGIIGNLLRETGGTMDPTIEQNGGPGRGLAQWEDAGAGGSGRWNTLLDWADENGYDPLNIYTQLKFIWYELESNDFYGLPELRATSTVADATRVFEEKFERAGVVVLEQRIEYAEQAFREYSGSSIQFATSTCSGQLAENAEGFVFPLRTTKSQLAQGSTYRGTKYIWCETDTTSCHGDYPAADIFVAPGTEVVAAFDGYVSKANERVGGVGSTVSIYNEESGLIYYFAHMRYNSLQVAVGQTVTAGTTIGVVGEAAQAVDTPPHVHFDVTKSANGNTSRFACTRTGSGRTPACSPTYDDRFVDYQGVLAEVYQSLPD